jgi:glyoxylase-like metal-dependent hydrolase (beta-lactamase superfamily II)
VRLTVVGCSGSGPGPTSPASSYLVEHDGFRVLLDLGNGAFGTLQALADPATVDALYLSHLHADHCLDVAPFIVWHRYSGRSRRQPVPLYAPAGADRRLAAAYYGDGAPLEDVFDFAVLTGAPFDLGPFQVQTVRTAHPVECHAVRLTAGGRSLVYTGDTGASTAVVELARGVDVLLAEGGRRARRRGRCRPPAAHPRADLGRPDGAAGVGARGLPRGRAGRARRHLRRLKQDPSALRHGTSWSREGLSRIPPCSWGPPATVGAGARASPARR